MLPPRALLSRFGAGLLTGKRAAEAFLEPADERGRAQRPAGALVGSNGFAIVFAERRGKEVGLPAEKVEAIIAGLQTSFADEREQVVYEMAMALANARWVPRGLYDRAVKALDHVGITDVITLMGHYSSVAMTLAFYDVPAGATGMAR